MPAINTAAHFCRRHHGTILTFLLVLPALAGPLAGAAPETQTPPTAVHLSAVEPVVDLGEIVRGDVATHAFALRNTGKEPLTIERVVPSDPWTVAKFDETIQPGGEGTVRVEVDTRTLDGVGSTSVKVYAQGHPAPAAVLELKFKVVRKLLARPGYARWIYVQHEQEGTIGQTVYASDGADFQIVAVESPMPAIKVSYREAKPEERVEGFAGRQWRVEPTLVAEAPVGAITGHIDVHTTHPKQKRLEIPVSGFVRPTLFVDPTHGAFGTLQLSAPKQAVFQVRNFATAPIALTAAETDVPGISAQVQPVEQGRRYKVVIEFDPAAMKEGPFAGKLRLKTDSPKVPMLTVDLEGTLVRSTEKGR